MAAILGVDPWRNAHDLWLEKTGRLLPDDRDDIQLEAGNLFETPVLKMAMRTLGEMMIGPPAREVSERPIIRVHTDAVTLDKSCRMNEPVEAKTHALFGPGNDEHWGDEGTDQVPDHVIVQCHAHMMAWDRHVCHVPALIGRRGLILYAVRRDRDICDAILDGVDAFWMRVVQDTPPADIRPRQEVVKMMRRTPGKVAEIQPEIVQNWLTAKEAVAAAESMKRRVEADLLAALGDAEAATCGDLGAVTFLEQTRKEHAVKASTFRVLRHKPNGL